MSSHKPASQIFDGISTEDVPSAGFGWSRISRSGVQIAGWISVLFLLAYNFGNHKGHVETVWLIALAVVLALGLIIFALRPNLSQVRTVTARNQPVGHVEPDWVYDQKTVSGSYAELSDAELRALNIDPARVSHLRVERGTARPAHKAMH
ncbi:MAG: DUF2631 domain-containing protein [Corynebacterium striatum]|uniref:DUF2631 domain-containing protein n=1 Tax=Corynebacterium TaxID=1716 RepID=UPI00200416D5|nr:DUF2631 domain-containing protein [uncultured Corynebacterium sp.]MCK6160323.1 DUF2631 domain-containing protein [Corynebacterium simulans]MDU3174890.1 DUF2631 domain-containing protein [Corynebacterium striatum]